VEGILVCTYVLWFAFIQRVVVNSVSFLQVLVCKYLRQQQLHWILIQQEICQSSSQHLP